MGLFSIIKNCIFVGFIIGFGFLVIDAIWISALPFLNISFGPDGVTLFVMTFLRGLVFLFWFVLMVIFFRRNFPENIVVRTWLIVIPNLLILVMAIYGFYIEPFRLTTTQIQIPVNGLKQPVRIVQLSDIHVERTTKRERELPALVNGLEPDMIVMTGDYLNKSYVNVPAANNGFKELIRQLEAPLGIYAVNGNVEPPLRNLELLEGLDVHVLHNEIVYMPELSEQFVLVGLSFEEHGGDDQRLTALMQKVKEEDFSLLLYHKPDLAYVANDLGVDFYLCGHTHGGQVRLPFYGAIYTNARFGKTFEMGLYQLSHTTMFITRGLGFTGGSAPRIRFLAPPEIVVIDLVPE